MTYGSGGMRVVFSSGVGCAGTLMLAPQEQRENISSLLKCDCGDLTLIKRRND